MPDKMQLLKQKISAANLTVDELAIQIGMNPSTFYRKKKRFRRVHCWRDAQPC